MVWNNAVSRLALASRRKVLAAAIWYAISVIVHFTSPVGAGTGIATHSAQRTNPLERGTAGPPSPFGLRRSCLTPPPFYSRISTTPPTRSTAPAIRTALTG